MSLTEEVIDATLEPDGVLRLQRPPQLPPGPVRVTIQAAGSARPRRTLADVIQKIAAEQRSEGYAGRTAEEMVQWEAERAAEDEERDRKLDAARQSTRPEGA